MEKKNLFALRVSQVMEELKLLIFYLDIELDKSRLNLFIYLKKIFKRFTVL